jgi:hypothetical protein
MATSFSDRLFGQHLRQHDLAQRWCISPRTLERWRWLNQGPQYLKIGGRVAYRMEDVLAYETARRRNTQEQAKRELTDPEHSAGGLPE